MGIIYCATNKINGKMYIGQTIGTLEARRAGHLTFAKSDPRLHFTNALRKYGSENFSWHVLDKAETKEDLNTLEMIYIDMFHTYTDGYNMTLGGDGGATFIGKSHTKESREKIANSRKGMITPESVRKKQSLSHKGFKHTEESKKKISLGQKNRDSSSFHRWSDAEKIDQSQRLIGIKRTSLQKEHYSTGQKNRDPSTFYHPTKEEKIAISIKMSGKKNPFYGKHHSDKLMRQIAEKVSEANMGKIWFYRNNEERSFDSDDIPEALNDGWIEGRLSSPLRGTHLALETRQKISRARVERGIKLSKESIEKGAVKNRGKKRNDEQRHNISEAVARWHKDNPATEESRRKSSDSIKAWHAQGKRCGITDGKINKTILEKDLAPWIDKGWYQGRWQTGKGYLGRHKVKVS
jgi:group I intron endonuclease